MRYQDKSPEEIRPIIDNYIAQYKDHTGREPDLIQISKTLEEMATEKERKAFYAVFEGLPATSLRLASDLARIAAADSEQAEVEKIAEEHKAIAEATASITISDYRHHKQKGK